MLEISCSISDVTDAFSSTCFVTVFERGLSVEQVKKFLDSAAEICCQFWLLDSLSLWRPE